MRLSLQVPVNPSSPSPSMNQPEVAVRHSPDEFSRHQELQVPNRETYFELPTLMDPSPSSHSPASQSSAAPPLTATRVGSGISIGGQLVEQPERHSHGDNEHYDSVWHHADDPHSQKIGQSHTNLKSSSSYEHANRQMEATAYRREENATRDYLGSPDAMCRGWDGTLLSP